MTRLSGIPCTPERFVETVVELYESARDTTFAHKRVRRGYSHPISGKLEDLMAAYLATKDQAERMFYVDQEIRYAGKAHRPDIVVVNTDGVIENFVDLKTDPGWNRNGLYDFAKKPWAERVKLLRDKLVTYKDGVDKTADKKTATVSSALKAHIVFLTMKNGSERAEEDFKRADRELAEVEMYRLTDGSHPNQYRRKAGETLQKVKPNVDDFGRLVENICS